jgi:uncharacterized protein YndB with AHSA1/START domain
VAIALESRQPVATSPTAVWGLLIEPRSWKSWWPAVRDARTYDFKPLREGARFEVTLQLGRMTSTITPRVVLCAEGKALTWDARWLGVPLHQEWFLEPRQDGCRVVLRNRFRGAGTLVLRLFRLHHAWDRMSGEQVRGLKRVAERL